MIRKAVQEDAKSISEIRAAAWQKDFKGIIADDYLASINTEKFKLLMSDTIASEAEIFYVFEDKGNVLGFASGVFLEGTYDCETRGLYVHPEYHGQGIGSELFETLRTYFKENECRNMVVKTLDGAPNNRFYLARKGTVAGHETLKIGGKEYQGVLFSFLL
ncbi:GNAT family N-acetyltransferase [Seleniivibrio sp.]|uniref:GNAT family N-acetyltransferase n=1 Tax=Seleniivibrio sp. TaxID=2898801 RepID=UPI0025E3911A|nr:GNAT family N-acetyltransferase [Seleniivibrio sp.]MCD8553234.1 GNAT family N-acetyltransferase [Seleniivibrio sp.]